jgi:hypothetical protein
LNGDFFSADLNYDITLVFQPLPRIPLRLLFNDKDDEFPAQCVILFERRAEDFLDTECLAIIGHFLADTIKRAV